MSELGWKYLTRGDKAAILQGIADGVAYGGPYHVEFHPADRCNVDCFFCSTAAIRGTDELPMPRFQELLGELREGGARSVRLAGGGEPLFHRKIREFLRAIQSSGLPIENVTTNAVLLRSEVAELLDQHTQVTGQRFAAAAVLVATIGGVATFRNLTPDTPRPTTTQSVPSPAAQTITFDDAQLTADPWQSEQLREFHDVVEWESWVEPKSKTGETSL